jgi:dihydroxyacetone kinase-like protein
MGTVTLGDVLAWTQALHTVYTENKEWLTALDAAIGDADHGINMARGFAAVVNDLEHNPPEDIAAALKSVAMTLIRTVGGASGPLYGTFFLRASAACGGQAELAPRDVVTLFEAGVAGVQARGRAEPGDKTMVDALLPATAAMQAALADGASLAELLARGAEAAQQGALATIPLQARKGRASYLGERSIGHRDPGAASSWLLVKGAAESWGCEC